MWRAEQKMAGSGIEGRARQVHEGGVVKLLVRHDCRSRRLVSSSSSSSSIAQCRGDQDHSAGKGVQHTVSGTSCCLLVLHCTALPMPLQGKADGMTHTIWRWSPRAKPQRARSMGGKHYFPHNLRPLYDQSACDVLEACVTCRDVIVRQKESSTRPAHSRLLVSPCILALDARWNLSDSATPHSPLSLTDDDNHNNKQMKGDSAMDGANGRLLQGRGAESSNLVHKVWRVRGGDAASDPNRDHDRVDHSRSTHKLPL